MKIITGTFFLVFSLLWLDGKGNSQIIATSKVFKFEQPEIVKINGYDREIMEPFLSRDGKTLFFNNLNDSSENTNLHWAIRIDDFTFQYKSEIVGVNTSNLEGVPTMDKLNNLYFVSNRNYSTSFSTIFQAKYSDGKVENVKLAEGFSKLKPPWVNFDVEVSEDGETLYLVDSKFNGQGIPQTGDIFIAKKNGANFKRLENSTEIFKNINTDDLEYAVSISSDELEIYFTRVKIPLSLSSIPEIYYATRNDLQSSFNPPNKLPNINGFAEAATISPDKNLIYFHKKESGKFYLYGIRKITK
ncbi:MAG: hypothetical protein ABJA66_15470 [Actinomycetota bacterium]